MGIGDVAAWSGGHIAGHAAPPRFFGTDRFSTPFFMPEQEKFPYMFQCAQCIDLLHLLTRLRRCERRNGGIIISAQRDERFVSSL